jgi:glycogen(starch) synthase
MGGELRIALVSREVYPLYGGGLGNYVTWSARALSEVAEVTIFTSSIREPAYRAMREAGDPRLPDGVRFEFVEEADELHTGSYFGVFHMWSARVFEALTRVYPDGGPDLVEFPDYHGEAAVSVQARRSADPRLRNTSVCVRLNTSSEMCQVLDGRLSPEFAYRAMFELERYAIANADHVVWPGGDVLGTYQRFYGERAVAPGVRIPHVAYPDPGPAPVDAPDPDGTLRLIYMGRLERRKGVLNLLRGLVDSDREDWSLTVVGADTPTGPLGISVLRQAEMMAAEDHRISFHDAVAREKLLELVDSHHVCVVPSLWECWPNVALEAFQRGRPVLGTPTGGLVEMVKPGRSGWLTEGSDPGAIGAAVERILGDRDELETLIPAGPRGVFDELTTAEPVRERYVELASNARARRGGPAPSGRRPLVTVVMTYYELDAFVEEAVASVCAQTYPELEVLIVNDGSLRERDAVLFDIADRYPVSVVTQPNSGLSAARNFGIALARGRYVLPFDADDVAEPTLVERCVDALEADPDAVYVATWSTYMHPDGRLVDAGYQPLGNASPLVGEQNVAGAAASLFRREIFDRGFAYDPELPSYEDWYLFRQLHEAGLYGHVVPERLFRYRVRPDSMLRRIGDPQSERFREEMDARLRERRMDWTAAAS